jgi:hypothetical protein
MAYDPNIENTSLQSCEMLFSYKEVIKACPRPKWKYPHQGDEMPEKDGVYDVIIEHVTVLSTGTRITFYKERWRKFDEKKQTFSAMNTREVVYDVIAWRKLTQKELEYSKTIKYGFYS